jgi:hypothetical protein
MRTPSRRAAAARSEAPSHSAHGRPSIRKASRWSWGENPFGFLSSNGVDLSIGDL